MNLAAKFVNQDAGPPSALASGQGSEAQFERALHVRVNQYQAH
jgi:hypothetical protein